MIAAIEFPFDTDVEYDCNLMAFSEFAAYFHAITAAGAEKLNDFAIASDQLLNRPCIVTFNRFGEYILVAFQPIEQIVTAFFITFAFTFVFAALVAFVFTTIALVAFFFVSTGTIR